MNLNKILGFSLGPIASAGLGLITIPILAWAFSPDDIGRFNLLQLLLSFSVLLFVLGLDHAYVREFHATRDQSRLLKECFAPGFLLLLAVVGTATVYGRELSAELFGATNPWFYPLVLISVVATYVLRFFFLILRMQERGIEFSISQIISKALQLVFLGAALLFGFRRDFLTLLWMVAASTVAMMLACGWSTRKQWLPAVAIRPRIDETRTLLKFGLPLAFSGLAYWGLTAISTLILRSHSTLAELAVYSVTSSFAGVATIFQSIFTVVWAPTVYKWASEGVDMRRVDVVARQALTMICAIFALVGTFSWLTDYMLPEHYVNVKYLLLCAVAPPLLYILSEITCVGIGISRRTVLTMWVTLAALGTNVLLSFWLIPSSGAAGAVIANAAAYLVYFVARTEASAYAWRQFPRKKLYLLVGLTVALAILTVIGGPLVPINFAFLWLFSVPVFAWFFRSEWQEMLFLLRKTPDKKSIAKIAR